MSLALKYLKMAEDEGFEPSVGCPTHAFQACALGRYANPPVKLLTFFLWLRVSVVLTMIYR
jgi:hypothetical protein